MSEFLAAVLVAAGSYQAFALVLNDADKEAAQNIQCIHLARMKVKNTIVQKPLFVQTDDGKLVRTTVNYHTDGKLYCSSKLSMDYIRERCSDLSESQESILESMLEE